MLYLLLETLRDWLVKHQVYWLFSVLDQLQFRALAAAFLAFIVVLALGRKTIAILAKKKIGDAGLTDAEALRATASAKANVPTMGGVLIIGAVVIATLLLADLSERYVQLGLAVTVWLAGVGFADDYLKLTAKQRGSGRQGLQEWEKLIFQLGIGALIGWFLWANPVHMDTPKEEQRLQHVLNVPFQKTYVDAGRIVREADTAAPRANAPAEVPRVVVREKQMVVNPNLWYLPMGVFVVLATLMIAGMSNAVNITDGMDGLAGGITAAVMMGIFILAMIAGDADAAKFLLVPHLPGAGELAVLAGATAGACLGFLWWNCWPARVFMGDTGALALGGIIGFCAVAIRQEIVILLMCGVFLAEIGSVVIQRYYFKMTGGKRVFHCAPYHHHLQIAGWPEQRVVARLWIISIILVVLGLASVKLR